MAKLTPQEASLLKPEGFYSQWKHYRENNTRERAYQLTEGHYIDIVGERKYSDFESFDVVARRFEKKAKAS